MIPPTIAPAATVSTRLPMNQIQAKFTGIGMYEYEPNPMEKPDAKPNNAPYFIPVTRDFGETRNP
jgi:hypothetical protein